MTPSDRTDRIEESLKQLRMFSSLEVLPAILKTALSRQRSFSSSLLELLEHELKGREVRAIANRMTRAHFSEDWTLASFPWERQPGVSKSRILELAELAFVREASNVCFIGDVGVGKTGLAIGLGREAVLGGHSCQFSKVSDLVDQLYASVLDRSTQRLIRRLAAIDLLVLDEFSYVTLNEEQANLLFKLIDARYRRKATILTSNLGFDDWGTFIPKKAIESALKDRVTDQCHVVRIEGPTLRGGPRAQAGSGSQTKPSGSRKMQAVEKTDGSGKE